MMYGQNSGRSYYRPSELVGSWKTRLRGRAEAVEPGLQIRDQVLGRFEPHVQLQEQPRLPPGEGGPVRGGRCGNNEALESPEAGANLEEAEPVEHRGDGAGGRRAQEHPKQAGGAQEIPLPQRVAGGLRQGRVEDPGDLGAPRQPVGHLERRALVAAEAHRQRAQSPQRFVAEVRSDAVAEIAETVFDRAEVLLGRSEEHTSELQSRENLVCRLLLEKKKKETIKNNFYASLLGVI